MSKTAFFFALYKEDKGDLLNNNDLQTIATELFLLMNLLDTNFNAWEVISNLITISAEHCNDKQVIDRLIEDLRDDDNDVSLPKSKKIDAKYFVAHMNKIHNALMVSQVPCIEVSLPSLRMIVLTEERLDHFIQTDFPQSFKLQKALVESQKGLGHEIFEALFIEGKRLANHMAYPTTIDPASPLSSAIGQRLSLSSGLSGSPKSTRSIASINKSIHDEDDYEMI